MVSGIPAIAKMAAKGDINPAVEDSECAPLILEAAVKALSAGGQRSGDIDRPARQCRSVLQRQRKNTMVRSRGVGDHGVEVNRLRRLLDHWGAGDPQGVDVPARLCRELDRSTQGRHPGLLSRLRIDCMDAVILSSDDKHRCRRSRRLPIEWLGVNMAGKARLKARVEMQRA